MMVVVMVVMLTCATVYGPVSRNLGRRWLSSVMAPYSSRYPATPWNAGGSQVTSTAVTDRRRT